MSHWPLSHTTDPVKRLEYVNQTLWTLARCTQSLSAEEELSYDLGGMARLLAETLDYVWSDLMAERDRCRCGQRQPQEG